MISPVVAVSTNTQNGFTLIEMVICISMIAILVCFAVPQYNKYIAKTHMAAAKLDLLYLATKMEEYFITHKSYEGATVENLIKVPHSFPYYSLKITQLSKTNYTLMATGNYQQQIKDKDCNILMLNNLGQKSSNGNGLCW